MAKVIGFDKQVMKKFTCDSCGAIVEYAPNEDKYTNRTDEGTKIKGSSALIAICFIELITNTVQWRRGYAVDCKSS